jgi:Na+-transporting methylmalonyl-CoA/oxaloacetate decarboxylase gamma subunit
MSSHSLLNEAATVLSCKVGRRLLFLVILIEE